MASRWGCALQGSELQPEIKPRCSSSTFMAQPGGPAPRFAVCTAIAQPSPICIMNILLYVLEYGAHMWKRLTCFSSCIVKLCLKWKIRKKKKNRKKKKTTLFIAVAVDSTSEDTPCESLGLITQKSTLISFLRCLNECAWTDFLLQPPQKT